MARYHLAESWSRKGERPRARAEYASFLETWETADADTAEVVAAKAALARLRSE